MPAENTRPLLFEPPATPRAHVAGMAAYEELYRQADQDPEGYWAGRAEELISWSRPWDKVMDCDMDAARIGWFTGGRLNVSHNCLDRHVEKGLGDKTAIIWSRTPKARAAS